MKKHHLLGVILLCSGLFSCSSGVIQQANYEVIPLPQEIKITTGSFVLNDRTSIVYPKDNKEMQQNANLLAKYIHQMSGKKLKVIDEPVTSNAIILATGLNADNAEAYQLKVTQDNVTITGTSEAGTFYGIQTLRKSLPITNKGDISLPAAEINDYPRFSYRGVHLDVSRHFFPADSVKRFIDMMALHNINRLHWHLTDDQGWRIEIKKRPELTTIGSKRSETVIGHNSGEYDGIPYSGFYTQDEAREIVKYAQERHITVIPEIDLPGHMQAALAAYPELGCTGGPYEVWKMWGVSEDVLCAGNDKTLTFIEDVLNEIIDIFPSEYIHVGGDECPKVRWEKCPKCQARIKAEGIKGDKKHSAEEYLQSYVISRMEKFVESKGRHIIGWDEILEGGLAPNATVMSWRGMDGGIEAAKQKHNVVMTPNTYVYLDYYQSADTDLEPDAIGGYLPLEKVYSFEPTAGISPEDQKYVIGAQANLWTEYIPTFSQVEYMIMPRIDAVADIQWSDPSKKDYQTFLPRVARMTQLYDRLGYNYGKHIFDINASLTTNTENGTLDIALTKLGEGDIYYTVDGSDPTIASIKYEGPVQINQDCEFKAIVVRPNGTSRIFSEDIFFNKATMKPITLKEQPSKGYVFNGAQVLVDGLRGGSNYKTGHWLGFQGKDLDATIDLKEPTEIQKVSFNTNVVKGDWIMGASAVTVKVSDDGKNFKEVASKKIPELTQNDKDGLYPQEISFAPVKARYVEVIINSSKLPKWHGGAGSPAFLFVDEIEIL